mmetsp:Transcript_27365/g.53721  ORF Transcript_27365/g.53721 Transcript_27365/m.53721 type:complete len:253 (+) Transcript_27365:699-1457(+)
MHGQTLRPVLCFLRGGRCLERALQEHRPTGRLWCLLGHCGVRVPGLSLRPCLRTPERTFRLPPPSLQVRRRTPPPSVQGGTRTDQETRHKTPDHVRDVRRQFVHPSGLRVRRASRRPTSRVRLSRLLRGAERHRRHPPRDCRFFLQDGSLMVVRHRHEGPGSPQVRGVHVGIRRFGPAQSLCRHDLLPARQGRRQVPELGLLVLQALPRFHHPEREHRDSVQRRRFPPDGEGEGLSSALSPKDRRHPVLCQI